MIKIPVNIEELKSYKPGRPIKQIIKDYNLKKTAILWNNENNFGPSPIAMKSVKNALDSSHLYPDPACLELRGLIADRNRVKIENVAVGNGSESLFNNVFNSFLNDSEYLFVDFPIALGIFGQKRTRLPFVKFL